MESNQPVLPMMKVELRGQICILQINQRNRNIRDSEHNGGERLALDWPTKLFINSNQEKNVA